MSNLRFNVTCRECLTSLGGDGLIFLEGIRQTEEAKSMTEYEYSRVIESWSIADKAPCQRCGSKIYQCDQISIDGYFLFDFDRAVNNCQTTNGELTILEVHKNDNHFKIKQSGKMPTSIEFIAAAFRKLQDEFDDYYHDKFYQNAQMGYFIVTVSAVPRIEANLFNCRVEQLSCTGFSRRKIVDVINHYLLTKEIEFVRMY